MREEHRQLLDKLGEKYREALEDISVPLGVVPEPIFGDAPEATGSGEMYAAMIAIKMPKLRLTIQVLIDEPAVRGTYFQAYADSKGVLLDDEIGLFCEFVNALSNEALARSGVTDVILPPCDVFAGENFRNVPSNKNAVIGASLPFTMQEGRLFINVAVHA